MRSRLGRFVPSPGSSVFERFNRLPATAPFISRALEQMLQMPLSPGPYMGQEPDLLSALDAADPDRPWVEAVARTLDRLDSELGIRLLVCEREHGPSGFLAMAVTSPGLVATVRASDEVQAGFAAMRRADGRLRIIPRVFRLVCGNGSIVSTYEGDEEIVATAEVARAIEKCFQPSEFESVVTALRAAAESGLPDPRPMLDEMGYIDFHAFGEAIRQAWAAEADPTRYGLINAMTAVARSLEPPDRFDLEEDAGRIAWLKRPQRVRPGKLEETLVS